MKKMLIAAAFLLTTTAAPFVLAQSLTTKAPAVPAPAGEVPSQVQNGRAKLAGHFNPQQPLRLVFGLQPPHLGEEEQFLRDLQDPKSPQFRKFLSAEQWNARFSPSSQDEQTVVDWARSLGLAITHRYPNRILVDVEAPAATIEKALQVTINSYQLEGYAYFSNDRAPAIPVSLGRIIHSVGGLNNIQRDRPASLRGSQPPGPVYTPGPVAGEGEAKHADGDRSKLPPARKGGAPVFPITNFNYDPTDVYSSQMYDYAALQNLSHCCNPLGNAGGSPPASSIALATFGPFAASDITGFQTQYPYLAYSWETVPIDGGFAACAGASCNGETTLDTEWSLAMANSFGSANDTAKIWVYESAGSAEDMYDQMLTDAHALIFSTSWSCTEIIVCSGTEMDTRHAIFNAMLGQGWTLLTASGDRGATDDCSDTSSDTVGYPASDPDVVGVGGTYLDLVNGSYGYEVAWTGGSSPGDCATKNDGGSGGGCSTYYTAPAYQGATGCGASSRAIPDIALNSAYGQNYYYNGSLQGVGGTSIASPEMAGFFAQEGAYLLYLDSVTGNNCGSTHRACSPMGNGNTYLYFEGLNAPYAAHYPFYDITSGCNNNDITAEYGLTYYCAGAGLDQVTGWGTANMLQLAWAINTYIAGDFGAPSIAWTGPATATWYSAEQEVSWNLTDTSENGAVPTGVAGFSQAWDSDPGDVYSEATPGSGNSFYSGPQYPKENSGALFLSNPVPGQGCHTANVRAWDNAGQSSDNLYGQLCFDSIPPQTTASVAGTLVSGTFYLGPVTVTLTATDPGHSAGTGSGVAHTYYQIDGGAMQSYTAAFMVTTTGSHAVTYHSTDIAGNVESTESTSFTVVSGTTTTSLTATPNPSNFSQAVAFGVSVTSSNGTTPAGMVQFFDGAAEIALVSLNSSGAGVLNDSNLAGGRDTITAKYTGSSSLGPSTSNAVNQVVNAAATTTVLSSGTNPSSGGETITFTATVSASGGPEPTGTVTFKSGATSIGTAALNGSGVATLKYAALTASGSPYSMTATYGGSSSNTGSTSPAISQVVNFDTTTTVLVASPNPSISGQTVAMTATVTPGNGVAATGTVSFYNGVTLLGNVALSGGAATLNHGFMAGTYSLSAKYTGSNYKSGSRSGTVSQVVNLPPTSTVLTTSPNPSLFGQAVMLTATVTASGATPTGTVSFFNGGSSFGSASLNASGVATLNYANLPGGMDSITATYSGSSTLAGSTSAAVPQVVQVTSITVVTSSANPSAIGQSVTFTATVTAANGTTPSGTVTFYNGNATLLSVALNGSGVAVLPDAGLPAGWDSISAAYGGSSLVTASNSQPVLQVVNPAAGVILTVAGNGTAGFGGDGAPATNAEMKNPSGLALASADTFSLFIADNQNCVIRAVDPATGFMYTVAGISTGAGTGANCGFSGDNGSPNGAKLDLPDDVAFDGLRYYIADTGNCVIRSAIFQVVINTAAGTGQTCGYSGDGGPASAAKLNAPIGVALDSAANFYIADLANCAIRKVTVATGVINTVAGEGPSACGYGGDGGPAIIAELNNPEGIAIDPAGNVYIADAYNSAVRKVTAATGLISTVAGVPTVIGYSGDGGPATAAEMNNPTGVAFDLAGNLYIADPGNCTIRKVTLATGVISTVAGKGPGACGYSGDGGPATSAALHGPVKIALDAAGNLFIADFDNAVIREVFSGMAATTTALSASPDPSTGGQTVTLAATVTPANGPTPTGSVTFKSGGSAIGSVNLAGGVATLKDAALTASGSPHSITAFYNGSAKDAISSSAPVSQVVNFDTTTTTLTATPNPSTSGQTVKLTATVTPANGVAAAGTVSFYSGSTLLGNASLSGGVATLNRAFTAGTYGLSATYVGSNYKSGSTSTVVTQTVN